MRRATTLLLSLALAATALTPARPAAAGPESPTAEEAERAHELFEKSKPLQDTKRYAEAAGLLRQAWSLQHSPDIAANLGMCEAAMGLYRDGAEHLAYAYRHIVAGATPEQRSQIKNALEIMKRQVATVRLKVEPAGAEVKVDGKPIGVSPLPPEVFIEPGERRLEVSAPGHRAETRVVAAKKGEAQGVEIVLAAEGGSAAPVSPASAAKPDGSSAPPAQPKDEQVGSQGLSTKTVVVIAGAGLTAVALGTGIGFHFKGSSAESDADDLLAKAEAQYGSAPCAEGKGAGSGVCTDLADKNDERASAYRISTIGFVAAGVFGVATAAAFVFWPDEKSKAASSRPASRALTASPWLGLKSAGVTVGGVF